MTEHKAQHANIIFFADRKRWIHPIVGFKNSLFIALPITFTEDLPIEDKYSYFPILKGGLTLNKDNFSILNSGCHTVPANSYTKRST